MSRFPAIAVTALLVLLPAAAAAQTPAPTPPPGTPPPGAIVVGPGHVSKALGFSITIAPGLLQGLPLEERDYATVQNLVPGSNAEKAGIRDGDILLAVNGRDGREPRLFPERAPGTRYVVRVRRGQEEKEITFEVGSEN